MSRYIIDQRYRLRGWYKLPTGLYDSVRRNAIFFDPDLYQILLYCNADHDFDEESLSERERGLLQSLLAEKVIRPARMWDVLLPDQQYREYPARYRRSVHWSVTGACNLKCRHCFMSAPHVKHGIPTTRQLMDVIDQLEECGICSVDITGGEPLIRKDFEQIIRRLKEKNIQIGCIYTNGMLIDGKLLSTLEENGMRPSFQLSFDGVGKHDFLRGVPGSEKRTIDAIRLLTSRGYKVECSMCVHRENADTIRETVNFLAGLGVASLKCGSMMDMGEWVAPEVRSLHLSRDESLRIALEYIPLFFEDNAPLSILLFGAFMFEKGGNRGWGIYYRRDCPIEKENQILACPVLRDAFYIGADGVVAPCQGMADTVLAEKLWSLKDHRLSEILRDSEYVRLSYTTVGDVRHGNEDCKQCKYLDRCAGGCRNSAIMNGSYDGPDPDACHFFTGGWEERFRSVADPAYAAYAERNACAMDSENDKHFICF